MSSRFTNFDVSSPPSSARQLGQQGQQPPSTGLTREDESTIITGSACELEPVDTQTSLTSNPSPRALQGEATQQPAPSEPGRYPNQGNEFVNLPNEVLWRIVGKAPGDVSMVNLLRTCRQVNHDLTHEFYGANIKDDAATGYLVLAKACFDGNQRIIDRVLQMKGCSFNPLDLLNEDGNHWTAINNNSKPWSKLVAPLKSDSSDNRFRYNEMDDWLRYGDMPPLHFAVLANRRDIVQHLLSSYGRGLKINNMSLWGNTPLHCAGSKAMVDILLKTGADLQARNQFGYTPLQWFMKCQWPAEHWLTDRILPQRSITCFRRLVKAERIADPQWQSHQLLSIDHADATTHEPARTLMGLAIRRGTKFVQVLLAAGADANAVELRVQPRGLFPRHAHVFRKTDAHQPRYKRSSKCFNYIWCPTPLQMAVAHGGSEALTIIDLLIRHGAHVDTIVSGHTALMLAVDCGHIQIVKALIEKYGADPNLCSRGPEYHVDGECLHTPDVPLSHAIRTMNVDMVKTLLQLGANAQLAAPPELLATMYATAWMNPDGAATVTPALRAIIEMLTEKGVDVICNMPRTAWYRDQHGSTERARDPGMHARWNRAAAGHQTVHGLQGHQGGWRNAPISWSNDDLWDAVEQTRQTIEPAVGRMTVTVRDPSDRRGQRRFVADAIELWEQARALSVDRTWITQERMPPRDIAEALEAAGSDKAQRDWLVRRFGRKSAKHLRVFRHYPSWTLLDEAMHDANEDSVEFILDMGVDPLSGLRGAQQMQYTPLGNLIMTANILDPESEITGPWTDREWSTAYLYMKHGGPDLTAQFPKTLLAQMLCQAMARLTSDSQRQERIREFEEVANCPWSSEGERALAGLVQHDAYWSHFSKHDTACVEEVNSNLVAASQLIQMGAQKHIRVLYPPLPENELRASLSMIFGENENGKTKTRTKKGKAGRQKWFQVSLR